VKGRVLGRAEGDSQHNLGAIGWELQCWPRDHEGPANAADGGVDGFLVVFIPGQRFSISVKNRIQSNRPGTRTSL